MLGMAEEIGQILLLFIERDSIYIVRIYCCSGRFLHITKEIS